MFGAGVYAKTGAATAIEKTANGQNDARGQFYGKKYGSGNYFISTFHIENLYGFVYKLVNGFIRKDRKSIVKMTPNTKDGSEAVDYNFDGTGYIDTILPSPGGSMDYIVEMTLCPKYGMIVSNVKGGSASTYYCDQYSAGNSGSTIFLMRYGGGTSSLQYYTGYGPGIFSIMLTLEGGDDYFWNCGVSLSYK